MSYAIVVEDDPDWRGCLTVKAFIVSQEELKEFIEKLQHHVKKEKSDE